MRAIQLCGYGDVEHLRLAEVETPRPGPGEVLIQVHYAGLNPVDFKTLHGLLRPVLKLRLPAIAGNEVAGVITALGQGTRGFSVGQRVFARLDKLRMGAFAEYVATPAELVALVPAGMSLDVAAGVPLVALTAWQALFEYGQVGPGSKVLIHAGAGAVGRVAIQMARHAGAIVATTVSERGETLVRELGAQQVINYRRQDFTRELEAQDFVLDTIGGDTLKRSFQVLRRGGRLCTLSATPEPRTADDIRAGGGLRSLFWLISLPWRMRARRFGVDYRFLFMRADGAQLQKIADLASAGVLRFDIDHSYPLEQAAQAYRDLEQGKAFGKLVLALPAAASA